jgi:hypothetical protein
LVLQAEDVARVYGRRADYQSKPHAAAIWDLIGDVLAQQRSTAAQIRSTSAAATIVPNWVSDAAGVAERSASISAPTPDRICSQLALRRDVEPRRQLNAEGYSLGLANQNQSVSALAQLASKKT